MTCQSLILIQSLFTLQLQILKVNSLGHKLNSLKMNILPELLSSADRNSTLLVMMMDVVR